MGLIGHRRDLLWGWPWGCALNTWKGGYVRLTEIIHKIDSRAKVWESRSPGSHSCKTGYKSSAKITNIHHKELISGVTQARRRTALERKQRSWIPCIWDPVFLPPPHPSSLPIGLGISQLPILSVAITGPSNFYFISVSLGCCGFCSPYCSTTTHFMSNSFWKPHGFCNT